MIKKSIGCLLPAVVVLFTSSFQSFKPIRKLSMDVTIRSLHNGKSVVTKGSVYFRSAGGLMVTRFNYPLEQIVITNAYGEYKNYNVATNTVQIQSGLYYSSRFSFFYYFLNGQTQDLGLSNMDFRIVQTRSEEGLVITAWVPVNKHPDSPAEIEIAHENHLPVYLGIKDHAGKAEYKQYFTGYSSVAGINLPNIITEIQYYSPVDSVITKREYSNLKVNDNVDETYLNFTIPSTAKIIEPDEKPEK